MARYVAFRYLLARSIGFAVLGVVILGYGFTTWQSPASCGGETMSAGQQCAVMQVGGKHHELLQGRTTERKEVRDARNTRSLDEQRAVNRGNARVMMICGALAIGAGTASAFWSRGRRSA